MKAGSLIQTLLPSFLLMAMPSFGGDPALAGTNPDRGIATRQSTEAGLSEATIQETIKALTKEYPGMAVLLRKTQRAFAVMHHQTKDSPEDAAVVRHVLQARSTSKDARPPGFQPLSRDERLRFIQILESDGSASYAPSLGLSLTDEDPAVRAAAAKALGAHTDPALPQARDVLAVLDYSRSRESDTAVLQAIDKAMGVGPMETRLSEATIQETIKALVKEHPGLAGMGPKAQRAFAVMHQQTKDSPGDAAVVHHVLQARAANTSKYARPPGLQPLTRDEQLRFVQILESDGSASYASPLSLSLFDLDPDVRVAAAKALGAHTDPALPQARDVLEVLELARSREPSPAVQGIIDVVIERGLVSRTPPKPPPPQAKGILERLRGLGGTSETEQQ